MALDLYQAGVLIGSVAPCRGGCYAYIPACEAIGQFHDIDVAVHALAARAAPEPVAA
ncbi:hypothetical protein [Methylobacterium sp. CM6246]